MAGMDWFRWHHGSVTDPKFQLVARKAGCSVAEIIGVWATLLEAASMADTRGCHGALDFEALDCSLGLDEGKAEHIYTLMTARGLVDAETKSISSWVKRQPVREREDDKSTERVKAFREKKRQETPCNASETPCNASETPCNAEKRLDKSREEKSINTPIPPSGAELAPIPEKTKTPAIALPTWLEAIKASSEKPIPEDDPVFVYADQVGIPPDHLRLCWREFRDRYSQPGAKRYRDWRSVFRKAVRGNWFKLWWVDAEGNYLLTTCGKQAEMAARQ